MAGDGTVRLEQDGEDTLVWVKAVPGASRDAVAGAVGERLKVRVSAPPEGGKANNSICRLIADEFNLKPRDVAVERGHSSAEKVLRLRCVPTDAVRARLRRT